MRAVGQLGDVPESPLGLGIVALLKQERAHAQHAELAGGLADLVELLLEAVADEHQRRDPLLLGLAHGMLQDPADLGLARQAEHAGHQSDQIARIVDPAARPAFVEAAVVHELHVEAAERRRLEKHLALHLTRAIPGRLARGGRIHREDQTRAPAARLGRRRLRHLLQKGLDRVAPAGAGLGRSFLVMGLNVGSDAPLSSALQDTTKSPRTARRLAGPAPSQ